MEEQLIFSLHSGSISKPDGDSRRGMGNRAGGQTPGMYVDEPIGMEHPLAMIKFQSGMDATLHFQNAMSLKESIESTLKHIRFLFGDDIPDELVRTTVSLTYAEHVALKPK